MTTVTLPNAMQSLTPVDDIVFKVPGESFGANSPDFNFTIKEFSGVNADGRSNVGMRLGWNIGVGGGRESSADAACALEMEQHYQVAGEPVFELHLAVVDTSNAVHRVFSFLAPKDGGSGGGALFDNDYYTFRTYAGTQKVKLDVVNNAFNFYSPTVVLTFEENNVAFARQHNAAGDSYISLPYIDSDNRLRAAREAVFVGNIPSTGTYSGQFFVVQASTGAADSTTFKILCPTITGAHFPYYAQGSASTDFMAYIHNTSTGGSARAGLQLMSGGSAASDPLVIFTVAGVSNWSIGLDNSDSDKFKVSWGYNLGSSDRLVIDSSGNITTVGYIDATEVSAPSAPASNGARIYAEDNGSGKTRLMVRFASGAAQQIAIEP